MRVTIVWHNDSAQSLARALEFHGYTVTVKSEGSSVIESVQREHTDLIIVNAKLADMDGYSFCRTLRSMGEEAFIFMVGEGATASDRVRGLDAGADDYITAPYAIEEFLARLRALTRRMMSAEHADHEKVSELTVADLRLNPDTREVFRGDRLISLTRTEYNLLYILLQASGRVLSRTQLFEEVWGYGVETAGNALDVYIGYLRKKLEANGEPRLVQTVRGVGYTLKEPKAA